MIRRPPRSTRTDTLFPYTTLFRSLGLLLYAAFAGPVAHLAPANWQWPESVAARVLDEPTPWYAGTHLMQRASPASWEMIVAADPLADGNREAIQACREAATKAKKPVRCTIEIKAEHCWNMRGASTEERRGGKGWGRTWR